MKDNLMKRDCPSILVVDDDDATRFIVREGLEGAGFDVEEAADGVSALALFESRDPDVVLLDIMMPDLDGFETCSAIRQRPRGAHTVVLVMTGLDDTDSINRAFDVGATSFVTKPIKPLILSYRIRYMLRAKQTADRLRESEARLSHAQRIARFGHWELDPGRRVVHCSQSACHIFGLSPRDTTMSRDDFLQLVHPADREVLENTLDRSLRNHKGYKIEHRIVHPDGSQRIVYQEAEISIDEDGDICRLIGIVQDVTERRRAEEKIRYLAYFDPLTGLPNRTFMREVIDYALANAARYKRCVAVLFLDIDHFKRINDTLGHDSGDSLLREVAQRLQSCVRGADQVCRQVEELFPQSGESESVSRLGGDEFVVILTEIADADAAAVAAQRITESLAVPVQLAHDDITVTASIGISVFPQDGEDAESILKHADAAMYHAKERGRNRYQFFTKELDDRAERRFSIEMKLRKALERNEFILHYQPKIDIQCNRVVGMEALLRWQQPEVGLISPVEFIPIAEELGLIVPIGEWVLDEASRQTAAWHAAGLPPLAVSVNLSAVQFKQRRLAQTIRGFLDDSGLDPALLELELTETMLIEDTEASATILTQLKDLGLNLSIDDFGTGYSSLSYLKRFPLNALKIDRSFVRDITSDKNDAAIVSATIALAHNLNLRVVAEGVEQEVQAEILRSQGCDEAQGYLYSRPLPSEDFACWIRSIDAFQAEAREAKRSPTPLEDVPIS